MGRFIEVAAGVDPPTGLAEAVHTQTEGNPLFVTEVVRLLVQEGELSQESGARDSWTVRIPEGVREVIGRRLNRLSQRCNETLTIASVIGREFELRHLTPLVEDISEDRLLEEALAARVIEELPQALGRYQLTHALIQETLSEELTLTRRVRLHARIAETLEELYGDNVEAHAAELAHHFAEVEAVLGTEKLVRYSLLAGERALAAFAWEEAQNHFERALTARGISISEQSALTDAEAAESIFGFARARVGTARWGEMQEVVDSLGRAFDYYVETGDTTRALAAAAFPVPFGSTHSGMNQTIGRALNLVAPRSLEEGRLLARYGLELGNMNGDFPAAQEAFERALAIGRDAGDPGLLLNSMANSAEVDLFQLRLEEAHSKSLECIELAMSAGHTNNEASARLTATRALILKGEGAMGQTQASAFLDLGEKLQGFMRQLLEGLCSSSQLRVRLSKGRLVQGEDFG